MKNNTPNIIPAFPFGPPMIGQRPPEPKPLECSEILQPAHDLILVERAKSYKGVIEIPESALEQEQTAIVIAAGPGKLNEQGQAIPNCCKPGDRVFLHPDPRTGFRIKVGERDLVLVGNSQILGVFGNDQQAEA